MKFLIGWLALVLLEYVMLYEVIGPETYGSWSAGRTITCVAIMVALNLSGYVEGRIR